MIFVGAVKILLYMKENHQDNYYTNDLMIGIIVVVVGVFVVFKIEVLLSIIPFFIWVISFGKWKYEIAKCDKFKKQGIKIGWLCLLWHY